MTSSLPRKCSTTEPCGQKHSVLADLYFNLTQRVMGIEPTPSAWKAEVLPLNYTRNITWLEGEGFEPSKAKPPDLQSGPFDRSGIPPNLKKLSRLFCLNHRVMSTKNRWLVCFGLKNLEWIIAFKRRLCAQH